MNLAKKGEFIGSAEVSFGQVGEGDGRGDRAQGASRNTHSNTPTSIHTPITYPTGFKKTHYQF